VYLDAIRNQNVRTAKVFGSHLRDFDRYNEGKTDTVIEELKAGKIDYFQLMNGYVGFLQKKGTLSNKYIGYSVKTARRFLAFHDVEVTDSKFRLKVKIPKAKKHKPSPLEKSDVIKIINECKEPRLKIYVHFLAATGCRAEEALSLRLGDLNFEKGIAHLHGEFTKTQQDRDIRLTKEIQRELKSWLEYKYRPRTIKSYVDGQKKPVVRNITPVKHDLDFVFMPYNEEEIDRTLTDIHKIRHHTKNAYLAMYKQFRPTMNRIGYTKVTFHTFRRYCYSTVSSLVDANYAEFFIGHENSEYWTKSETELAKLFHTVEPYLTYIDVEGMEVKHRDIESKLQALTEQNARQAVEIQQLQEKLRLRTENLYHKESILEILERRLLQLSEKVEKLEGQQQPKHNYGEDMQKQIEKEHPDVVERVKRWEEDRKERT
ncbi:MAG TPA: tyrosine-type recombinase/integrase, partial [Nitrososphaera sp.]|nr:tyrosine-type recombinase/integrase [Nitrososphaera sp.]